jgi:Domain of unknown function (DUF4375)
MVRLEDLYNCLFESENTAMKPPGPVFLLIKSEQERAEFLAAGFELPTGKAMGGGEFVRFEIAEDDPRFEDFARILRARADRDLKNRMASGKANTSFDAELPNVKSGQTLEQLFALEGKSRIDSLVLAFDQAITQKAERTSKKGLTYPERVVLAVEALEREVNNGGYDQFFTNSSLEFAPTIVESLTRIGCEKAASITQKAINALGASELTVKAIDTAMATDDEQRQKTFAQCDDAYYKNGEPIAERLFAFIKANKAGISL